MQFTRTLMNFFFALFCLFAVFANTAGANPIVASLEKRDVFVPPVLYPHAGTQWYTGQTHNVTWDTSFAPVNITNKVGRIYLRFYNTSSPFILAANFDILLGRIEVTVPWVDPRTDYQVVLFGDSGNFSPYFSINE